MDGRWAVPANGVIEWVHNVIDTSEIMYYLLLFPEYHHSFLSILSKSFLPKCGLAAVSWYDFRSRQKRL